MWTLVVFRKASSHVRWGLVSEGFFGGVPRGSPVVDAASLRGVSVIGPSTSVPGEGVPRHWGCEGREGTPHAASSLALEGPQPGSGVTDSGPRG